METSKTTFEIDYLAERVACGLVRLIPSGQLVIFGWWVVRVEVVHVRVRVLTLFLLRTECEANLETGSQGEINKTPPGENMARGETQDVLEELDRIYTYWAN